MAQWINLSFVLQKSRVETQTKAVETYKISFYIYNALQCLCLLYCITYYTEVNNSGSEKMSLGLE